MKEGLVNGLRHSNKKAYKIPAYPNAYFMYIGENRIKKLHLGTMKVESLSMNKKETVHIRTILRVMIENKMHYVNVAIHNTIWKLTSGNG